MKMGSASSLFFSSNDTEKQTLHRRCTPSDDQFDEQRDRWNALAQHLVTDLKRLSGHPIRTWLQGSYKFGTQIRPVRKSEEFDIDLGIYFEWEGTPSDGKHGPKTLRSFVQDSLVAYSKENAEDVLEVCKPKTRCSRMRYKDDFHIDLPSYHIGTSGNARTLATQDGWEESDPKAIYLWFRDLFDEQARARVRRQVRYIKTWAALKFADVSKRPSSILLTVLVAEAAQSLGASQLTSEDEGLADIVHIMLNRLDKDRTVPNPVNSSENLVRLSDSELNAFIEQLELLWDIAQRATAAETEWGAADIWQEAFEYLFPLPDHIETVIEKSSRFLPAQIVMPEIRVTARPKNNPLARPFENMNQIGPIPKNCDIEFQITNFYALPNNSKIIWIVRNEGREAEHVNDLGHVRNAGAVAIETSAYRGTHFMDCFVKVSGKTVAMRRVPVTITGQEMPVRNPKKPAWTDLRSHR